MLLVRPDTKLDHLLAATCVGLCFSCVCFCVVYVDPPFRVLVLGAATDTVDESRVMAHGAHVPLCFD